MTETLPHKTHHWKMLIDKNKSECQKSSLKKLKEEKLEKALARKKLKEEKLEPVLPFKKKLMEEKALSLKKLKEEKALALKKLKEEKLEKALALKPKLMEENPKGCKPLYRYLGTGVAKSLYWKKMKENNPEEFKAHCQKMSEGLKDYWNKLKERNPEEYKIHCLKIACSQTGVKKPGSGIAKSLYWMNFKENNPEEYKIHCQKMSEGLKDYWKNLKENKLKEKENSAEGESL